MYIDFNDIFKVGVSVKKLKNKLFFKEINYPKHPRKRRCNGGECTSRIRGF
jgi:hypothetical protein